MIFCRCKSKSRAKFWTYNVQLFKRTALTRHHPSLRSPVIPQVGVTSRTAVGLRNMLSEEVACKRKGARAQQLKIQLGKRENVYKESIVSFHVSFQGVYLKSLHKKERSAAISMFRSAHRSDDGMMERFRSRIFQTGMYSQMSRKDLLVES